MNTSRRMVCSLCLCSAVWTSQQLSAVEDDQISDLWKLGNNVAAGSDLRKEKRRELRDGEWVHSYGLDVRGGYIDNVFLSPESVGAQSGLEESSPFYSLGVFWTLERDFDRSSKMDINITASQTSYLGNSVADSQDYSAALAYDQDLNESVTWESDVSIEHSTDDATDVFGNEYNRDFAYTSYRVKSGFEWKINDEHKAGILGSYQIKDYNETATLNSIDWNEYLLRFDYRWKVSDQFKIRIQYDYAFQFYDEEPANNVADGLESPGNPDEEHVYNKFYLSAYWYPTEGTKCWLKGAVKSKTDEFEDFESYRDIQYKLGASSALSERWYVKGELELKDREYDNRPGTGPGDTLNYDQMQWDVQVRRHMNHNQDLYFSYVFAERSSNRNFGSVYRDYVVNSFSIGYTFAY